MTPSQLGTWQTMLHRGTAGGFCQAAQPVYIWHLFVRRSFAKDVAPQVNDMIKWARDEHIPIIYTLHGADLRTSVLGQMS